MFCKSNTSSALYAYLIHLWWLFLKLSTKIENFIIVKRNNKKIPWYIKIIYEISSLNIHLDKHIDWLTMQLASSGYELQQITKCSKEPKFDYWIESFFVRFYFHLNEFWIFYFHLNEFWIIRVPSPSTYDVLLGDHHNQIQIPLSN